MTRTVTRTIYAIELQTNLQTGSNHELQANSSIYDALNDSLVVPFQPSPITAGMENFAAYDPGADTKRLTMKYLCIGNGSHYNVTGPSGGHPYPDTKPHLARHSGLYSMIPFICRPVSNDLDATQRQKYRMRKTVYISGVLYAFYFARVIDTASITPEKTLVTIVEGEEVVTTFAPTINDRRPTPPSIGTTNDGSYTAVSALLTVNLSAEEVQEIKDAVALLFGDVNQSVISELALCHGCDSAVTERYPSDLLAVQTPVAVTPNTYYEVVGMQVAAFATTVLPLVYVTDAITFPFNVGNTEPLYGTNEV